MTDARSFIHALALSDKDQALRLLKNANPKQWMGLQTMARRILDRKIPVTSTFALPRQSRSWVYNFAYRHKTPKNLKRSVTQRGGNKAQLASQVLRLMAKTAAPHVKKLGKQLVVDGISSGVQSLLERKKKKKKKIKPPPPPPPPTPTPLDDLDDDDEAEYDFTAQYPINTPQPPYPNQYYR